MHRARSCKGHGAMHSWISRKGQQQSPRAERAAVQLNMKSPAWSHVLWWCIRGGARARRAWRMVQWQPGPRTRSSHALAAHSHSGRRPGARRPSAKEQRSGAFGFRGSELVVGLGELDADKRRHQAHVRLAVVAAQLCQALRPGQQSGAGGASPSAPLQRGTDCSKQARLKIRLG